MFGEHAAFIIPSYAVSFVALAIAVLVAVRIYRLRKTELRRLEAMEDR